ncbi:hypothetical protein GCM10023149_44970 [Mucilaginibacter gynuensis]|uniref:Thioredoxin domain-containing protein n=2 Tax=Mucilaginibacter gynuensis TaxID=1302236 RepID=A0ABP8HAA8_9SPHI
MISTKAGRLDTNLVAYDEQGKALRYYQYTKLLNSGQYTMSFEGPQTDKPVMHIKKLSVDEQNKMFNMIRESITSKSPGLKEGSPFDTKPLESIVPVNQLNGKVLLLLFWYANCPPCTEDFASINKILKQVHNPEDITILAITTDNEDIAAAKLKEKPVLYAKLISGARDITNAYKPEGFPAYVVVDKAGITRLGIIGSSPITMQLVGTAVRAALTQ